MTNEEKLKKAHNIHKNLTTHINHLARTVRQIQGIRKHAADREMHEMAMRSTVAIRGLDELIDCFIEGQETCLRIISDISKPKKVEVENLDKPKLRLIRGGKS